MWNLPRPGIEPMSPAQAGRFLSTGQPGKSCCASLLLPPPTSASINLELGNWGSKVDDPDGKTEKRVIPSFPP